MPAEWLAATCAGQRNVGLLPPNTIAAVISLLSFAFLRGRASVVLNSTAGIHDLISACHTAEVCTICTSLAFVYTANLVTAHLGTKRAGQRVKWLFLEDSRAYKATVRARLHGLEPLVAENSLRQWARNLCAAVIRATILFTSSSEREPKDCSADSLQSAGQCRPSLGRG